jgi:hypothetical protein
MVACMEALACVVELDTTPGGNIDISEQRQHVTFRGRPIQSRSKAFVTLNIMNRYPFQNTSVQSTLETGLLAIYPSWAAIPDKQRQDLHLTLVRLIPRA